MRIGTNISSLIAQNQLARTSKAIARSLQRLGSGQRVNSPADDAAAYSIGVKLTSQIRGLTQATLNINSALGMVQTAEAAVSSQVQIVQRIREIAIQASNGTLTDQERSNLNLEVQSLYDEYNRITQQTEFAGTKLLDGSFGPLQIQMGPAAGNSAQFTINSTQASSVFVQRSTVGNGTFGSRSTFGISGPSYSLTAADINEDGYMDLVVPDNTNAALNILIGRGDGTFKTTTTLAVGGAPYTVKVKDINSDGNLDLVSADNTQNEVSIYLGNGNGTFETRTTFFANGPRDIALADLNGDNQVDIITASTSATNISVRMGNGNGTFSALATAFSDQVASAPKSITTGDFTGDGILDAIVNHTGSSMVSLFVGNGNGTFAPIVTFFTNASFSWGLQSADLNGDNKLDIVSAGGSATAVLLGNGNGTFQTVTTYSSTGTGSELRLADLNGDNQLDIVRATVAGNAVAIQLGNGNGTFKSVTTFAGGNTPRGVETVDLNGDGVIDIITSENSADNSISVFLGNSVTKTTSINPSVSSVEDAATLMEVADNAIANLNSNLANIAAIHSRLESAVAYNLVLSDSLSEARSRALDLDYAIEVSELVRNQILQQAQIAVLSQANLNTNLGIKLLESISAKN